MNRRMSTNNDEISRELKELGLSTLASLKRESGQKVPGGYFEAFPDRVWEDIERTEKPLQPQRTKVVRLRTAFGMAASFLLLIALGISIIMLRNGKEEGFLADGEEFFYDEYFAKAYEMDRTLLFDLILTPEDYEQDDFFNAQEGEEDFLLDYLLDAAPYNGIEPMELISQQDIDNQH